MSSKIPFIKMQAIGNDFVLIDARNIPPQNWPQIAIETSDRHFGIGHDGLLVVMDSQNADYRMRMFNPDGTEDMCGNGLCCITRYLSKYEKESEGSIKIETLVGIRHCRFTPAEIQADMGLPLFDPKAIPAKVEGDSVADYPLVVDGRKITLSALSTGTAHAVIFGEIPDEDEFRKLGPAIENHPIFPERITVNWVRVVNREEIRIHSWERGAGPTLGCGTGACAAMVSAYQHGLVGDTVSVTSVGGTAVIQWKGEGEIRFTVSPQKVFQGEWILRH